MIGDDFTIDYTNKRIWNKYAWGQGGTATVYSVNALYSWLMDIFDEQGAMDDTIPMTAQTPNAYTLVNEWFIDDETVKYLKEGAITTARGNTKILKMVFQASGYTNAVFSDITKQVVWDVADHGALLAYDNTRRVWWCRTADVTGPPEAVTINGGAGVGTCTSDDNTGEDLYANIYTLGTIESGTQVYIYQAGAKIAEWWSTGHIDILVKVAEYGSEIDGANISVFARVYTDLYDYFDIDLTSGGRNAVPMATANDLDNQGTVATILNYMDTIRLLHVNGTIPYSGAAGDSPVKHKVIHGQTSLATAFILNVTSPFELANIEGTFQNAEVIEICEELKFDLQTSLFTVGTTIDNGGASTAVVRKIMQDPQGSGAEGILFVTGVSGAWSDNDPIEEGVTQRATQNGAISTNTFTANTSATVTFADTVNRDLDNGVGAKPYNVVIDLNGLSVANLYEFVKALCRRVSTIQTYPTNGVDAVYAFNGERYKSADTTYTQIKKASPYGTFAGGKFFGARGIWIEDMLGTDSENYSLIDADNGAQNPPTSATIMVVSMVATTDRVLVCESTGSGQTEIKKNQYTLTSQTNQSYIEVSGAIADDAPATGVVRVVVNYGLATQSEDIYNYIGIDRAGADDRFTLAAPTGQSYDSGDRAYNPYIDANADGSGNREVIVKYAGSTKYIVTRVRLKAYIPFQVAGSFANGLTTITSIRTADGIYQP